MVSAPAPKVLEVANAVFGGESIKGVSKDAEVTRGGYTSWGAWEPCPLPRDPAPERGGGGGGGRDDQEVGGGAAGDLHRGHVGVGADRAANRRYVPRVVGLAVSRRRLAAYHRAGGDRGFDPAPPAGRGRREQGDGHDARRGGEAGGRYRRGGLPTCAGIDAAACPPAF